MKSLKILNLQYGASRCRFVILKEFVKGTRDHTLYVVAELPFYDDDNAMKLRADLLGSIAYKSYSDALEAFNERVIRQGCSQ